MTHFTPAHISLAKASHMAMSYIEGGQSYRTPFMTTAWTHREKEGPVAGAVSSSPAACVHEGNSVSRQAKVRSHVRLVSGAQPRVGIRAQSRTSVRGPSVTRIEV